MRPPALIQSIQAGIAEIRTQPAPFSGMTAEWTTGFYKTPVAGQAWAGTTKIMGDEQADLRYHGGPDKAVCVYPSEHYAYWRDRLGLPEMNWGAFGENLSTQGLLETEVSVGDLFSAGEAHFEISQPRQPCWKLARRWGIKNLPRLVEETGYTGWYFRVRKEGAIQAGSVFSLLKRPFPELTLARANHAMYQEKDNPDEARVFAECDALSESWRRVFTTRL